MPRKPLTTRRTDGMLPPPQRSAVTNGKVVLPNVNGNSPITRRYKDIASALLSDAGGLDFCSESKQQLIRRFAAASVLAEQLESRVANGEQINITEHTALVSSLVRLANKIGIARHSKTINTPTVESYLSSKRYAAEDDADIEEEAQP